MNIINMTPHDVHIIDENGQMLHVFPASGKLIRLVVNTVRDIPVWTKDKGNIPTSKTVFEQPEGLPAESWYATNQGSNAVGYGCSAKEAEDDFCGQTHKTHADHIEVVDYYIVSQIVKNALPNRNDLLVPAEVVRDEKGIILGCKSLGR